MTDATTPAPDAPLPVVPAPPPAALPGEAQPTPVSRRSGLDPATRRQTVAVAVVIAALFFGSQIVNEALPANAKDLAPGEPVAIGRDAQITPLGGWVATLHDGGQGVRLEKGVVVVDLFAETVGASAGELAGAYLDQVLRPGATQLTVSDTEVATTASGTAARFTYQGLFTGVDVALEGEVTAFFTDGQGIVADAWSRQGDLGRLLGEVHAMLETVEVRS